MGGREPVEGRQFLDAGRAPGRPQVDEHRTALEIGEADLAAVGILEADVGRGLALVTDVNALDRAGLGGRLSFVLPLRGGFLARNKGEQDQGNGQGAHGLRR